MRRGPDGRRPRRAPLGSAALLALAALLATAALLSTAAPATAQVLVPPTPSDTLAAPRPPRPDVPVLDTARTGGRTPGGALRRALALPGWGQVYNRQPAKAPFMTAAVAGAVGAVVVFNGRYVRYRHAYLYAVNEAAPDPTTPNPANPYARYFDDWVAVGARPAATLRPLRDGARRNRDLAALATGAAYALQALDAYVHAHLADFAVGDDLALSLRPAPEGAALALTWRLSPPPARP